MAQLEQQELETLRSLQSEFSKGKSNLGELEIQKQQILNSISNIRIKFAEQEKILVEKYGSDSVINMETGEITKKENKE